MKKYLLLEFLFQLYWQVGSVCDSSTSALVSEGNIGQSDVFSWLGVLRVHLRDGGKDSIAVTGVVLVQQRYALVSADDVAKIPHKIFMENSRVMFLGVADTPWFCGARSYTTHPEYGISTYSTVALLELDLTETDGYPMRPICWPDGGPLNTGRNLYVTGYTDENQFLEKTIYRAQFVERETCIEFYDRAGLGDKKKNPVHSICTYCPTNRAQCVFDNGMVLVTNATKHFSLVGFGIHGPGCNAPARFVDLQRYSEWIRDSTTDKEDIMYPDYRRAEKPQHIPLHNMFRFFNRTKIGDDVPQSLPMEYELYPFPTTTAGHYSIVDIDNSSFYIHKFNETVEIYQQACMEWTRLVYREYLELKTGLLDQITAFYKISLIDLESKVFTCARLSIESEWRSEATFSFKTFTEVGRENVGPGQETPEYLLKRIPIEDNAFPVLPDGDKQMTVKYLKEIGTQRKVFNYDLFVQFKFKHKAVLKLEIFSRYGIEEKSNKRRYMPTAITEKEKKYLKRIKIRPTKIPKRKWYEKFKNYKKVKDFVDDQPDVVGDNNNNIIVGDNPKKIKVFFNEIPDFIGDTYLDVKDIPITIDIESGVPTFIMDAVPAITDTERVRDNFGIPTSILDADDYETLVTDTYKATDRLNRQKNSIDIFNVTSNSSSNCISNDKFVQVVYFPVYFLLIIIFK